MILLCSPTGEVTHPMPPWSDEDLFGFCSNLFHPLSSPPTLYPGHHLPNQPRLEVEVPSAAYQRQVLSDPVEEKELTLDRLWICNEDAISWLSKFLYLNNITF